MTSRGTFESLTQTDLGNLEGLLAAGTAPRFSDLVGHEFRGWNVLTPVATPVAMIMGIQRFAKGFFVRDSPSGDVNVRDTIEGYNIKIKRGAATDAWAAKPNDQAPTRHSFFCVHAPTLGNRTGRYPHALLLDYSQGDPENGLFDGRGMKDFVVHPVAGNTDLLLGKAYITVGPLTVVGSYFVAERLRRADFHPAPVTR